jgi:tellurite resistance protein TerC
MGTPLWAWLATVGLLLALLVVDLVANRNVGEPSTARALIASGGWIAASVAFGAALGVAEGSVVAQQYFAGYVLEKALSVDNVFVFVVLFGALAVPLRYQHRVLYYGVVGALALRAGFIAAGAALLDQFGWVLYVFGVVLLVAGLRMLRPGGGVDPDRNLALRAVRRVLPVTDSFRGDRFVVKERGRVWATPLLVALVAIESTDVVFATDSIPAVFGVTQDPFVVFTSNAFAVLGLRSLYFVFARAADRFEYLRYGLALLLIFIGLKFLVAPIVHVSVAVSLAVIVGIVGVSILASLRLGGRRGHQGESS